MSNIINATPDEDGRVFITLYGKEIEIDESMFNDGVAIVKAFGKEYEIRKTEETKPKTRKSKKTIVPTKESGNVKESITETEPAVDSTNSLAEKEAETAAKFENGTEES